MRIAGIDPSSACCGFALVENGRLLETDSWRRPKTGSAPERLYQCYSWMVERISRSEADLACVEFLSVERNATTTRVVSHYQAACTLACKQLGLIVVEARVSAARKVVLGDGSLSKEETYRLMRERFPDHQFGRFDVDGGDRVDATVLACAAPTLAERT